MCVMYCETMTRRSRVDLICLVDSYHDLHKKASSDLKRSMWNLNKARRQKGGSFLSLNSDFSAMQVREELRSSIRLECKDCPALDEEEQHINRNVDEITQIREDEDWTLLRKEVMKTERNNQDHIDKNKTSDGLRQRKGEGSLELKEESKWSVEIVKDSAEETLRRADPIDYFGALPPKDLKVAQKDARDSFESYIKAANIAAEILQVSSSWK